jgi:hypothetical protein
MNNHSYVYSPAKEQQSTQRDKRLQFVTGVAACIVFATIGVLLAWRG